MKWAEYIACMGGPRNVYKILVGKPERTKHRWEENIRIDLREMGWSGVDWIHLAHVRDQ